jgi:multidrug resistance protein
VILAAASIGVAAVLPVLPVFAASHGADPRFIGWMVASYSAANLVCLPVGGWLSDRFGRKAVMAIGLIAYALASLSFLLTRNLTLFIVLRAIEGIAAACVVPAAMAYAADHAPAGKQGTVLARMTAAENVGILIGPMIGGVLADLLGIGAPFWVLAVLCTVCLGLLLGLDERPRPTTAVTAAGPTGPWWRDIRLALGLGLAGRNWAGGFSIGMYEVIWPLFMLSLGSTLWQISLSWTLFAVPSILLSPVVGRWIDRMGGKRLIVWGTAMTAVLPLFYASAGGPWPLILIGTVEGIGMAIAYPAYTSLLMQVGPEQVRGRVIGWIGAVRTIGIMVASFLVPGIYARDPVHCFGLTAAVLVGGAIWLAISLLIDGKRERQAAAKRVIPAVRPLAGNAEGP